MNIDESQVRGHCILMLRARLGKVVHTVKRAGTYAAKVPPQELHKIGVYVRAVTLVLNSRVLLMYTRTDTAKELSGYPVQNSPSGSFLF